jgi:hypothetical protein
MCDYSLMHVKSRAANVGDKLVTRDFGTGTRGFSSVDDPTTAICVLPGTELAFDSSPKIYGANDDNFAELPLTARFRQINKEHPHMHHDALEFADGRRFLLTFFTTGHTCTVLQLPAAPRNDAEAKEQERVASFA